MLLNAVALAETQNQAIIPRMILCTFSSLSNWTVQGCAGGRRGSMRTVNAHDTLSGSLLFPSFRPQIAPSPRTLHADTRFLVPLAAVPVTKATPTRSSPDLAADVLRFIDDQCAEPLSDFAESRQALIKRFGMTVYADVMTEFASAC